MDRIVGFYRAIICIVMGGVILVGVIMIAASASDGAAGGITGLLYALVLVFSAVMALGLAATAVAIHDRQIQMARTLERIAAALETRR